MIKDNYILIDGPNEQMLKTAVQQLSDLYSDTEFTKDIQVFKSIIKDNQFVIRFTNQPDFERFKYFVNYLHYPEISKYSAIVMGLWTLNEKAINLNHLSGKRILLYVSESDQEGDNVYGIMEDGDITIKLGFALGEEYKELDKKEFDFREPEISDEDYTLNCSINPNPENSNLKSDNVHTAIIALVIIVAFILYMLMK